MPGPCIRTTRDWVEALTIVLATGEVLDLRRGDTLAHPDGYFDIESVRPCSALAALRHDPRHPTREESASWPPES